MCKFCNTHNCECSKANIKKFETTKVFKTGRNSNSGANGTQIIAGNTDPSPSLGSIGDFFLDKSKILLYGPKTTDGWGVPLELRGPTGQTGQPGDPAANYVTSVAGKQGTVTLTEADIIGLVDSLSSIRSALEMRVTAEAGKSLVSNTLITKLLQDYTSAQIDALLVAQTELFNDTIASTKEQVDEDLEGVRASLEEGLNTASQTLDSEIEAINERVDIAILSASSNYIPITGVTLPTLTAADKGFSLVGPGVYEGNGQTNMVVPASEMALLVASGGQWIIASKLQVPNDVLEKIQNQKGIPGGIAPLNASKIIPPQYVDTYTKNDSDTKFVVKDGTKKLSDENYTGAEKAKVGKIKIDGDANKYLSEAGTYNTVTAPIQSISIDGVDQEPDESGNIELSIPDAPLQGIVLNGEPLVPDPSGIVVIETVTDADQTLDPQSTNAVSSAAVAAALTDLTKDSIVKLALNVGGEPDQPVFSISGINASDEVVSTTDEFSGGGGGGAGTATTKLILTKLTPNQIVKESSEVKLQFYYDHRETESEASTGLPAQATITITSGAITTTRTQQLLSNSNNLIDVTQLVQLGSNNIRVRVSVDNGTDTPQVSTIAWSVQVVSLRLSSSYNWVTAYPKGSTIVVPYNLSGSGTKILKVYLNGTEVDSRTLTSAFATGSFSLSTLNCYHGSNSIQLVAEIVIGENNIIRSNSIYFDVPVYESSYNTPIVAARFDNSEGIIISGEERPTIEAKKFADFVIRYAGFHKNKVTNRVILKVNNNVVSDVNTIFTQRSYTGRFLYSGLIPASITVDNIVYNFNIDVSEAGAGLVEPSDNIKLVLRAIGRTNDAVTRDTWNYENITTSLTNVRYSGDGWINNALRLNNGGKATINYRPFSASQATKENAFAFTVRFRTSNVTDTTVPLISCMDDGVGFEIKADSIVMRSRGNSELSMKMAPEQIYNIALVSFPLASPDSSDYERLHSGMMYLYIDGIISAGVQRASAQDSIYQTNPKQITIQGVESTLDVYTIRAYDNYLTDDQVLNIHILDLDSVEKIEERYKFNNVIDTEGNVTVDSVPSDMRYIIITGAQANGMSTVEFAAAMNNKDARYDVTEILHIKKSQPHLNFRLEGGCIRLQGTSSLAYPIKNYRIYTRNSAKVPGRLYLNTGNNGSGGELSESHKFSFKAPNSKGKLPAPVDCWCLKADFAESSSSHNTGMAKLANDVLIEVGDKTPAQEKVAPSYPYDVRTTVDGEPCYLFYRNTLEDQPVFLGKYNMNNDKSTEDVFGFLNIPGYHDAQWVQTKFGGQNPTECWEFLNNDYPMGMYLDDNFTAVDATGKREWTKVFEARFPDIQDDYEAGKDPVYLRTFVSWVKSTANNGLKFKNELANYMDVDHLCSYYMLTDLLGAVDQRVKNAMLGFWYDPDVDKVLGYYIFYDNDTILGLRNDGRLKYYYDIDHNTIDPELSASAGKNIYAFAGHDSVLWKNLREQFAPQLETAYKRLRSVMTNEYILNMFDKEQSDKFAERIYNIDAMNKYIKPKTLGVGVVNNGVLESVTYSYLEAMQGSRKAHRRWWLINRLEEFDAKFGAGQYTQTDITWKGISDAGAKITAVTSKDYYLEVRREGDTMKRTLALKGVPWEYVYNQTANIGTIFHLFGGKNIKILDLSNWGGFTDLNIPVLANLEELILGNSSKVYTLSELVLTGKFPRLKRLDLVNYTNLPFLDLRNETNLEVLDASGCTIMTDIQFAEGAPLRKLTLPPNLNTLSLRGVGNLTNANIIFPDGNSVKRLIVEQSPSIDWVELARSLPELTHLRVTNFKGKGYGNELSEFAHLGGVSSTGENMEYVGIEGTYILDGFPEDYENLRARFPLINFVEPEFSYISMKYNINTSKTITNYDNQTGYLFANEYKPSGHIARVLGNRFRCLGKQTPEGIMNITKLHDENSLFFDNGSPTIEGAIPAAVDGTQGDVLVYEPRFWYKSLVDGMTTYLAVSAREEKPSNPDPSNIRKIIIDTNKQRKSYNDNLVEGDLIYNSFTSGQITASASASSTNTGTSTKIDVKGYKKGNIFHTVVSQNAERYQDKYIILFTDENNMVVDRKQALVDGDDYFPSYYGHDMRLIVDIPENAKWMYITWKNDQTQPFSNQVVLSKTDNIWDLAVTDWSEHTPELIGAVATTSAPTGTRLGSFKSTNNVIKNTSINSLNSLSLTARKLHIMSYFQHKIIAMMELLKEGAISHEDSIGAYVSYTGYKPGDFFMYGMQSSKVNAAGSRIYPVKGSTSSIPSIPIFAGYEYSHNAVEQIKNPVSIEMQDDPNSGLLNAHSPSGSTSRLTLSDGYREMSIPHVEYSDGVVYQMSDVGAFDFFGLTTGYRGSNERIARPLNSISMDIPNEDKVWLRGRAGTGQLKNDSFKLTTRYNMSDTPKDPNSYTSTETATRICFPFSDKINIVGVTQFNQITNFL